MLSSAYAVIVNETVWIRRHPISIDHLSQATFEASQKKNIKYLSGLADEEGSLGEDERFGPFDGTKELEWK